MDSVAIGEVDVSVHRKEGVESSQNVSKEEESNEDTVAVEGCVTPVDMNGCTSVAVDIVVVIFGREFTVGL